jgi:NtrC-family two-component system response regulator AlgB
VVHLPALRERLADLPNLAARFLAEEAASLGRELPGISVSAMDALVAHDWPGNIRELRHEISRAALFLDDGELLDSTRLSPGLCSAVGQPGPAEGSLELRLEQFERAEILRALERAEGDVPEAAELLGIGRSTLYRRIKALGVRTPT